VTGSLAFVILTDESSDVEKIKAGGYVDLKIDI
jgi:hypothetical protein